MSVPNFFTGTGKAFFLRYSTGPALGVGPHSNRTCGMRPSSVPVHQRLLGREGRKEKRDSSWVVRWEGRWRSRADPLGAAGGWCVRVSVWPHIKCVMQQQPQCAELWTRDEPDAPQGGFDSCTEGYCKARHKGSASTACETKVKGQALRTRKTQNLLQGMSWGRN